MTVIIETERLWLRVFTEEDAALVCRLNSDPAVTAYTGDPIRDEAHALDVLQKVILPQYALYGHGRWAVHTKPGVDPEGSGFIGWCGLKMRPELNEIDLGYRFLRSSWGKGYATEAAAASLRYGFERLGIQRIVGRALPENKASIRVLEKCGMLYKGEEVIEGLLHVTYESFNPLIHGFGR